MENLYNIGGQIWVQKNGDNFMGPGRIELLENLCKFNCLKDAAESSNMDYSIAVKNIKAINKIAREPLAIKKGDDNFTITEYGKSIIETYKKLKTKHDVFLETLNKEFVNTLG